MTPDKPSDTFAARVQRALAGAGRVTVTGTVRKCGRSSAGHGFADLDTEGGVVHCFLARGLAKGVSLTVGTVATLSGLPTYDPKTGRVVLHVVMVPDER